MTIVSHWRLLSKSGRAVKFLHKTMRYSVSVAVIAVLGAILASELPSVLATSLCADQQKYIVQNLQTGSYITVNNPSGYAEVTLEPYNFGTNQQFCLIPEGGYIFIALDNDDYQVVLDVEYGNDAAGASVIAYTQKSSNNVNQLWQPGNLPEQVDVIATALPSGNVITGNGDGESLVMEPAAESWDLNQLFGFQPYQ